MCCRKMSNAKADGHLGSAGAFGFKLSTELEFSCAVICYLEHMEANV